MTVFSPDFFAKVPPVDFCQANANKTEVFYYLFKSRVQTTAMILNEEYILHEDDKKLPVKVLIHGYTSNVTTPWYKKIKTEYFKRGPHNIIYIDWSLAANRNFAVSAANIKPVGEYIADFLISIQVPLEKVHIIGHSLGAHLAGFVGRHVFAKTQNKVARITGTDPGGPGFEAATPEARLSKYDARFVDVYHTDAGFFGIKKPIGHVDFYLNSGQHQPGCPLRELDENCSHARSNDYFIESIFTRGCKAKMVKMNQMGQIITSTKQNDTIFGDAVPTTARGMYSLITNSTAPFLIEKEKKKKKSP